MNTRADWLPVSDVTCDSSRYQRVHMKERPHICNHCGKGFVSLYSMQRHEMIHTNSYRWVAGAGSH